MNPVLPRRASRALRLPAAAIVAAVVVLGACKGESAVSPKTDGAGVGAITLTLSGLPAGGAGDVLVQGPSSFSRTVTGTTTLADLVPGTYIINAHQVTVGGVGYAPTPASQSAVVGNNGATISTVVKYVSTSGSLAVTVSGLPAGASAAVTVTGPNSYSQTLTGSATLGPLRTGTYTIDATSVSAGGTVYAPTIAQPDVSVTAGATASGAVAYAPQQQTGADLSIAGMYVVQSVQKLDRSVPLVAGRDGLLRVFVRSNQTLAASPTVRVKLYLDGQLSRTLSVAAPVASVPTTTADVSEGTITASWNVVIPGSLIAPGLSVSAQVDPYDALGETDETDNAYPATGAIALSVAAAPAYRVRFVPIAQPTAGTGDVNPANVEDFLAFARKIHPVLGVDADVRATYTASYNLSSDNADKSWTNLLGEIEAKRTAEGSDRAYYGVVKTTYTSGIAGLGYVGAPAAIGWDYLQTGRASEVMAHEIGHNFDLLHAPCGGAGGVDTSYPYTNGATGVYGYDVSAGPYAAAALKAPTMNDIMGYCNGKWISDYNYKAIMSYRASAAAQGSSTGGLVAAAAAADATSSGAGTEPCLLVWGRIVNGVAVLEPAFAVTTRPSRPGNRGPLTLRATSASGATLWSRAFAGTLVADTPSGDRSFAFAIPVRELGGAAVAELRVEGAGRVATARVESATVAAAAADSGAVRATRGAAGAGWLRLRWDASRHPVVMVRDAQTGAVLSFARGGDASVRAAAAEVDVALPNRVRHGGWRVRVAQ